MSFTLALSCHAFQSSAYRLSIWGKSPSASVPHASVGRAASLRSSSPKRSASCKPLVTDYETDRLWLTAEMAVRFALALDVMLDELVHPNADKAASRKPSQKVLQRLEKIGDLPPMQQTTLLRTIDTFLEGAP